MNIIKRFKEQLKGLSKKATLRRVFIFVDCIILLVALGICAGKFYDYYSNGRLYKSLKTMYNMTPGESNQDKPSDGDEAPKVSDKFKDIQKLNKDTVGWIKVENTRIDYPVVQYKDNEYYLHRNFEKKDSSVGVIFMDFRNRISPLDRNIIIYGHHMKDGSMFKDLILFKDKDFFMNNPTIIFNTLYQESKWEIFSVYSADAKYDYLVTEFAKDEEFIKYINEIKSKSDFKNDVQVNAGDHILTLSTCSYEFSGARTVVHAKLIK